MRRSLPSAYKSWAACRRTAAELRVSLGCGVGGTLRDGGFFSASQAECAPPKVGTPIAIAEGVIAPVGHTCDSAPCAIVEQGGLALEAPSSYDAPTASLVAPAALGCSASTGGLRLDGGGSSSSSSYPLRYSWAATDGWANPDAIAAFLADVTGPSSIPPKSSSRAPAL